MCIVFVYCICVHVTLACCIIKEGLCNSVKSKIYSKISQDIAEICWGN